MLAVALLKIPAVSLVLSGLNQFVVAIDAATTAGTVFLFGFLGGGEVPFLLQSANEPYVFAFRVLPQIIMFSVIVAYFGTGG